MNQNQNNPLSNATPKDYLILLGLVALVSIICIALDMVPLIVIAVILLGVIWGNYIRNRK